MKHKTFVVMMMAAVMLLFGKDGAWAKQSFHQPFRLEPGRVVVDQAGRRVKVERPFKRIISLYGAHTENLYAMGAGDQLVGVSTHDTYPEEVQEKKRFSFHDGPERFLAARPDLILIRPMLDRGYGDLFKLLESNGVRVISVQPKTIGEMFTYWKILGLVSGHQGQAEAMIGRFRQAVAECRAAVSRIPPERRKRVYFESIHGKMKTFSPQSMAIFVLTTAGGINVAADAITVRQSNIAEYGKERILAHGDQIDVYLAQVGPMNRVSIDQIVSEPGFRVISAVSRGQVHLINEKIVSRPTMRLLHGIYTIGHWLYPDVFGQRLKVLLMAPQ